MKGGLFIEAGIIDSHKLVGVLIYVLMYWVLHIEFDLRSSRILSFNNIQSCRDKVA